MKKLFLIAVLAAGMTAMGQSTAELLQKGIYTQETLGDLDSAIRIYRQVMTQAGESRGHAAQAVFRLGQCLLRKGAQEEAREVFQKLIADYPEQKDLVAKAREFVPGDLKLQAEPWTDGEVQIQVIRLPGGMEIGVNHLITEAVEVGGKRAWRHTMRQYIPGGDGLMTVDVERDTSRPLRASFRHKILGDYELEYENGAVRTRQKGKSEWTRKTLDRVHYDNTQAMYIVRRLPLTVGFKQEYATVTPLGAPLKLTMEVTARETLTTPAGKFDVFKVEIPDVKQSLWVSADANRYVVKAEVNGAFLELTAVKRVEKASPSEFRDAASGLTASMPAGWAYFFSTPKPSVRVLYLIEPDTTDSMSTLGVFEVEAKYNGDTLEADFKERLQGKAKELEGYQPRANTLRTRTVNGKKVVSVVADYQEKGKPRAELLMWTQGGGKRMILNAQAEANAMAALESKLDPLFVSNVR